MAQAVISIKNLSKAYQLGAIGTGRFCDDLKRWWALRRGLPDPYSIIEKTDHGNRTGETLWALQDINLSVQKGEAVGIIGRNGAGKSTLLKILSRVTAPTTGEVKIKGRIASLLEVGTGFHPELTGRENIFLNGAIMGMSRSEIRRKFDAIVDFSGVEQFIDTPVKRYSSGMYVRLAFAVAAHLDPDILVVDEVLAVGDAEFQKKCLGKMKEETRQEGRTVLFVSHNITAIQSLCTTGMYLKQGAVESSGDISRVTNDYLSTEYSYLLNNVWSDDNAPGNEYLRVKKVEVIAESNDTMIDVTKPLRFLTEFQICQNTTKIAALCLVLKNIKGECIFNSVEQCQLTRGLFRAVMHVPGNFLNDDTYAVDLYYVNEAATPVYVHQDCMVFQVHDLPRTGSFFGKWIGAVRPKFKWDCMKLGDC